MARWVAGIVMWSACSLTPIPDVDSQWSQPCDLTVRICAVPFQLAVSSQTSVEVRGDFTPTAWTSGVPMTKQGDDWVASIDLPWGHSVQYKFFVDGSMWQVDPANPNTVVVSGDTNSVLTDVQCAMWTCSK